ncbi:MAG: ParB/RepB/Spo0J family partition protein [Tannerella sp.]|jgi:ParB family chromosome partitioning protein|nr:ParB/RepB/Spo0J family partition protein [Tannerella sp.]
MAKKHTNRLGRGLDALISTEGLTTGGSSSISEIELSKIEPNPDQPRSVFDTDALEDLAASIRAYGIIVPITLKEVSEDKYLIIAGERRYRAALMAGLERVPAYIKTAADENVAVMALIENIQREDLNAIEIALTYQKLIDSNDFTQEQLSERVGKRRATIANYLRLLKLPAVIQVGLKDRQIEMGHARALLPVEDPEVQLAIYEQILHDGLSVRSVEELVRHVGETPEEEPTPTVAPKKSKKQSLPDDYTSLQEHLSSFFGAKVKLTYDSASGKGKITIPFQTEEELEAIMGLLDKMKQ